jgi:hypothetical protein
MKVKKSPTIRHLSLGKPNNDRVIISSEQYEGEDKPVFICSWCSCTLSKLIDCSGQNPSLYCSRCQMSFDPEYDSLRKESKITVPDRSAEPCATSIQTNMVNEVEIRHTPEMRGSFRELSRRVRFTSYHTTEKE